MSYSKVDIINMALGHCGINTIASVDEKTMPAIQASLFWDNARRTALRDHPYNFAQARVVLAEKEMPDEYYGDWRHCYALPKDGVRILAVHAGLFAGKTDDDANVYAWIEQLPKTHYAIRGGTLYSNAERVAADIVMDITDVSEWDDMFVEMMARKLACMIAVPLLKNNPNKVQELNSLYREALNDARSMDVTEESRKNIHDAWLAAREMSFA